MSDITYANKDKNGSGVVTIWRDIDANEVKTAVNSKADGPVAYTHDQQVASALWTVNHNLGYKPGGIFIQDSAGSQWLGDVTYINNNTLTINLNGSSFAGKAYIS